MSQARPDARAVRGVRLAVVLGAGASFALAYAISAGLRSEVDRAAAILGGGAGCFGPVDDPAGPRRPPFRLS
ncbi:MAG: hypothetical protein AVDCRST_MAG03-3929 [uncultured Rubrobacteraceae bacterium]|uniref:Uncharacterized protein n=1 Tax=uncultured Rubrobacteraceae bacterium TaxID=349277 RepID=A0A6J4QCS9_9ACTN|nr:MAG: hypothetical protein AVDCRST_MAG03-3929 [uncultured Rubrobacteraceae bacterium]